MQLSNNTNENREIQEIFVSKNTENNWISRDLKISLEWNLGIKWIQSVKLYNNYLIEWLTEKEFQKSKNTIFAEAPVDDTFTSEEFHNQTKGKTIIAIESNPGQYDNRVDAVEQNILLQTSKLHKSRYKKVIVIDWKLSKEDQRKIKEFLYNPTDQREVNLEDKMFERKIQAPENHVIMNGFKELRSDEELRSFTNKHELSFDLADIKFIHNYFKNEEKRDPTKAELLLIDTYWSDHCRHTTFNTKIKDIKITGNKELAEEIQRTEKYFKDKSREKWKEGNTFMEIAQASFRFLKDDPTFKWKDFIDISIEDNAASYKTEIELENWEKEIWVIMFKNETHNYPTEIEPFWWAATCVGWAIRDTQSGRAYTFAAVRVSGAKNPTEPISATLAWKLSQRAISIWAALWYSSYGNQIGLATTRVKEHFHPGYVAKRFECGYVLAAVKEKNLKRKPPTKGDIVIMLGWKTGNDGWGWAKASSSWSKASSKESQSAHIQKWNPVEERKYQRLLLNPKFTQYIKKSNDFWAGWVSVALWELSRWIDIDLDIVASHTKYEWLSDEELLLSESQERMSIVIDPKHYDTVMKMLEEENIEAFKVAEVTNRKEDQDDRLRVLYKWKNIVNISRSFLDTNGAERSAKANIHTQKVDFFDTIHWEVQKFIDNWDYLSAIKIQLSLLENASQRWLWKQFDNSVWASTILAPFGWKYQSSPQIWSASKIPTFNSKFDSKTAIISTEWLNPYLLEQNTYVGGIYSVIEALSKAVALWWDYQRVWVSMQEYFGKLTSTEKYWDIYAGLLWTLKALIEMKVAAIWGKDSASWTDDKGLNVPPTIVTFANTPVDSKRIVSAEFKKTWSSVGIFKIKKDRNWLPDWKEYRRTLQMIQKLIKNWHILSSSVVDQWWVITAISKLTLGNKIGFEFHNFSKEDFLAGLWDIIVEFNEGAPINTFGWHIIWKTSSDEKISVWKWKNNQISIEETQSLLEWTLENVWPTKRPKRNIQEIKPYTKRKSLEIKEILKEQPTALIPVFPGSNSELDTKQSLLKAWFKVEELVFNTLSPENFIQSRDEFAELLGKTNLLVFPGWFSLGDEPEGSAKFIANIMRSPEIKNSFQNYLNNKNNLTLWICNGFQALIKLWVFENWNIKNELRKSDETLTYNESLRHETELVRLKVTSLLSPFLSEVNLWEEYIIPISHSEWRIIIPETKFKQYENNWQIPLQYRDEEGRATNIYNGSAYGIAALSDPTWRILGMMPHPERHWLNLFKNIPGGKYFPIFKGAYESLKKN